MTLDVDRVAEALLDVTQKLIAKQLAPLKTRLAQLETKSSLVYRGAWQASAETYVRGDVVTAEGTVWHANTETRDKPGTGTSWTLMAKGPDSLKGRIDAIEAKMEARR